MEDNVLQLQLNARFHRVPGVDIVHFVPGAVVRFAREWDVGHLRDACIQNFGFTWHFLWGHGVSARSQVRVDVAECKKSFVQNGLELSEGVSLVDSLITGVGVEFGLGEEDVQFGQVDVVGDEDFGHLHCKK